MLRVWLPLTKDLRNQGLSDVTVTNNGATYSATDGKLGGCYSVDNVKQIGCNNCINLGTTFSIAFWSKINSKNTNWGNIFKIYKGSADYIGMCLAYTTDTNPKLGFHIYRNNGSNVREKVIDGYKEYSLNEWFHTVITITPTKAIIYKNSEAYNTFTISETFPSVTNYSLWLGKNGIGQGLDCSINDFRLYDHALSPMEVKQISQGLVLHYPLDNNGWGQENLLKNSGDLTLWNKESGINCEYDSTVNMYKIYSTTRESSRWGIYQDYAVTVNTDTDYTLSLTGKTDGYTAYLSFGAGTSWPANYTAFTSNKQRLSKTLTIPAGTTNIRVYLAMYPQTGGGHVYFEKPKLEEGSIATPWCPNSSDTLATTMGMNDGIEYDCSGFGNNGTRVGTFSWSSDTPKYSVSQSFNGTDNVITLPSISNILQNSFTMNVWFRKNELGSKNYETLFGGPSGFEMDTRAGGASTLTLYMPSPRGGTSYTSFQFGEWYMVTLVNDGTNELYYINGELVKTIEKKAMPNGTYFIGAWNSITSQNYKGLMSDFRIYATALSASDIQSLYQNSAYIDSSGNIYGAVHEEV